MNHTMMKISLWNRLTRFAATALAAIGIVLAAAGTAAACGPTGQKPLGTVRIFVLGESVALGIPASEYGFSRMLGALLRNRFPARPAPEHDS